MYLWNDDGARKLEQQARTYAEAARQSGVAGYDETLLKRMEFFASRAEAAIGKLLGELAEHSDPFWPPLPPKMDVPAVEEPDEAEVRRAAGPPPRPPAREDYRTHVPEPGPLARLFGGRRRYERRLDEAEARDEQAFRAAADAHGREMKTWREELESVRRRILERKEAARKEAEDYNQGIDEAHALRASPTAEYLEKTVLESVLRTFYGAMSNLNLPLPGPEYIAVGVHGDAGEAVVEVRAPEPAVILPPGRFELDGNGGTVPVERDRSERGHLYGTYCSALALGTTRVVSDLVKEASLHDELRSVVVSVFTAPGEGEVGAPDGPARRCVTSVRVALEAGLPPSMEDHPAAALEELGGRLASDAAEAGEVAPYAPLPSGEAMKESEPPASGQQSGG